MTRPLQVLLGVIVVQAAIGFVQYATDLPILLVGLHMLGAALVSAAVTWVLITRARACGCPGAVDLGSLPRVGPTASPHRCHRRRPILSHRRLEAVSG